jgi:subfamily B ATP-binding cassette protein HlyB/CyaB
MNQKTISNDAFFWVIEGLCGIHRKPFSRHLATQQLVPPYGFDTLIPALKEFGFSATRHKLKLASLHKEAFPLVVEMHGKAVHDDPGSIAGQLSSPALVLQADGANVLIVEQEDEAPRTISLSDFAARFCGAVIRVAPVVEDAGDADSIEQSRRQRKFGFRWFLPELLKHKKLWQEVLVASLVIQLIALATPLFTQAVIDKVVVHRTQSTLVVIALGMGVFMVFSAVLTWLRQYLVLHTGNRVDAVLGSSVFSKLFQLPPMYFQHRPTGVIAARLQGVETIREFISSAAVSLVLDLPFLLIFVAVMFYYSVTLTLIVLAVLTLITGLSVAVAPLFQTRLQEQFQLGARNQAFLTEYVAGVETVKSLQLEPQLNSKYSGFLASYLSASFQTRQLANTYNSAANLLEQFMSLLILAIGAYTVMRDPTFSIGMLIAFQMFSGRLSQPMLRLVGLWQQFQQASLSVQRLGDLMNAPAEPYSLVPARDWNPRGEIQIETVAFKYAEHLPVVYQNLSLAITPGQTIGIMGPSGCGKSTLAKLLQGFYQPSAGRILIDGIDIRYLSANELRAYFGVVPQETVLFSGTIYDNLLMACPSAGLDQIIAACKMAEIHTAIEALPKGYQTEIGERGAGLSGGQKQRIAIARALLKRPSILVFDEATSALDPVTAEQFAKTVNALRGKVTMLFISHGLPKGLRVDAIYRLGPQGAQQVALAPRAQAAAGASGAVHANPESA